MEFGHQKAVISTEYCSRSSRDSNEEIGTPANRSAKSQSPPKECSMCGDVGFHKELFQCNSCLFRYQHTYCSSSYPKLDSYRPSCEWCIYFKGRQADSVSEKLKAKGNGGPLKLLLQAVEAHSVPSQTEILKKRRRNSAGSIPRPKGPRGSADEKGFPNVEDESLNRRSSNRASSALERWRQITKNKLQNGSASSSSSSSSARAASGRRYKLLADFLC